MTTTSKFQQKADYYNNIRICEESKRQKINTNIRYRHFTQTHFTAGDEQQFNMFRDESNGNLCNKEILLDDNLFKDYEINKNIWYKYLNIKADSVINTFRYIFYKLKKGIFIKIKNNKLRVFLPFSNVNFKNEWSERINVENNSIISYLQKLSEKEGHKFNIKNIHVDVKKWYANNCIFRYDKNEGDSNTSIIKNMLEELCENREVPDIELFINRRDFPIITVGESEESETKEGYEPYNNIWDSKTQKLVSHNYEKYSPILSMSKSERYSDILIPTWDDWARVQSFDNKFFKDTHCKTYFYNFDIPWEQKKSTAVFRGSSTGCGVDIETNPRLKVAFMSSLKQHDDNNILYLDAGITKWNLRARKIEGEQYLKSIDIKNIGFDLVEHLSPYQQSSYKYIIHIQGHVAAFRLSLELSMKSVILLVESEYKIWYTDMLEEYVHYVPVKSDLSNLISQIDWCKQNDQKCKEIADNAEIFYNTYLSKKSMLDYMQKNLIELKQHMGTYIYLTPNINWLQTNYKLNYIREHLKKYPVVNDNYDQIYDFPQMNRTYGFLQGIEFMINFIDNNFFKKSVLFKQIKRNENDIVSIYNIKKQFFIVKETINSIKISEHINEIYIAKNTINNLSKFVPNFSYVFGSCEKNNKLYIISEYVHGQTLLDYILSDNFNFKTFLFIILQICLALKISQNKYGFVHWDLTPWNIIIQRIPQHTTFDYFISHDQIYRVHTNIIPVIIDYGKSHAIFNEEHVGIIQPYKCSTIQDILYLLLTSVDNILNKKLSRTDLSYLFKLINFITNTGYRQETFKNILDIKIFISENKKYANIINSNKYELEQKCPMNMFEYIINNFDFTFNIELITEYNNKMNYSNGKQVFDYIFASNFQERLSSFTNIFQQFKQCSIPQPNNLLLLYYSAQYINNNLASVFNDMFIFLKKNNLEHTINKYEHLLHDTTNFLKNVYLKKIKYYKRKNLNFNKKFIIEDKLINAPYSNDTFLNSDKIIRLIKTSNNMDFSKYKEILEYVLYNGTDIFKRNIFKVSPQDVDYFKSNFSKLLQNNTLFMLNNNANIKTLRNISSLVYSSNIKYVSSIPSENICPLFKKKILKKYQSVLNKIKK